MRGDALAKLRSMTAVVLGLALASVAPAIGQDRAAEARITLAAGCREARDPDRTRAEITALLASFLAPEQNPTRAAHERFWADDLVYTSSAGKVTNKAEILKSFGPVPSGETSKESTAKVPEPEPVYSAEDVLVRPYGELAALTFRLVARAADGTEEFYRNSGTFLYRDGKWQAITWQATKVPPPAK